MKTITLITGGARSGKSRFALDQAQPYTSKAFIATAQAFDKEMAERIANHQATRTESFVTYEAPLKLSDAILQAQKHDVVIVDCLTVWLGNLFHHGGQNEEMITFEIDHLKMTLPQTKRPLILVTNELGMGIVPENEMARRFRDVSGTLNQQIAAQSDLVYFLVSGLASKLKG